MTASRPEHCRVVVARGVRQSAVVHRCPCVAVGDTKTAPPVDGSASTKFLKPGFSRPPAMNAAYAIGDDAESAARRR